MDVQITVGTDFYVFNDGAKVALLIGRDALTINADTLGNGELSLTAMQAQALGAALLAAAKEAAS